MNRLIAWFKRLIAKYTGDPSQIKDDINHAVRTLELVEAIAPKSMKDDVHRVQQTLSKLAELADAVD